MASVSDEFLYNDYASGDDLGNEDADEEGATFPSQVIWTSEVRDLKRYLFPTPESMSESEKQYYSTKQELYNSERMYLKFLLTIQRFFMDTLDEYRSNNRNNGIKKSKLRLLFAELPSIYNINKELLRELRKSSVDTAFRKMAPFLKTYAEYARNYPNVIKIYDELSCNNEAFNDIISRQQAKPPCQGNTLMALMIMPVQRIPRYIMLLNKMRESTSCESEAEALGEVLKQLEEIAVLTESCIRDYENQQELYRIQRELDTHIVAPGRRILKEGYLYKISQSSDAHDERMFWLFNDILVYGKRKIMSISPRYSCSCIMPLKHGRLVYNEVEGSLLIFCKDHCVLVTSDSYENLKEWYQEIQTAVNRVNILRSTLRKESSRQQVKNFKNRIVKKFTNKFVKKTYAVNEGEDQAGRSVSQLSYSDSEAQVGPRRSRRKRKADTEFDNELRTALQRRRMESDQSADDSQDSSVNSSAFDPAKKYSIAKKSVTPKLLVMNSSSTEDLENIPLVSRFSKTYDDSGQQLMTKAEKRMMHGTDETDRAPRTRSRARNVLAESQRRSAHLSHPEIRMYSYQEPSAPTVSPSVDSSFEADPARSQLARDKSVPWWVTESTPALYTQKKKGGIMESVRSNCSIM